MVNLRIRCCLYLEVHIPHGLVVHSLQAHRQKNIRKVVLSSCSWTCWEVCFSRSRPAASREERQRAPRSEESRWWCRLQGWCSRACPPPGNISSELYGDWLWDENFKFCLIFTHFSRFSPFSGYIWWNNTLSSLENFSLNSILFFLFLMSHPDNGGFLKIAQKRDSISKKTSFCIMVINTDHQESWFLSVGHPLCALR